MATEVYYFIIYKCNVQLYTAIITGVYMNTRGFAECEMQNVRVIYLIIIDMILLLLLLLSIVCFLSTRLIIVQFFFIFNIRQVHNNNNNNIYYTVYTYTYYNVLFVF